MADLGVRVPYHVVSAAEGKRTRAEPVAALYEQGRVHHVGRFSALEEQLCAWTGATGEPSPDRPDALVWAVSELARGGLSPATPVAAVPWADPSAPLPPGVARYDWPWHRGPGW